MRLTSYNVAIKILHAKGCFADMVDRMWGYMEEGDVDKAQCAREKALGMYALIETAKKWSPTITDGIMLESHVVISSVNQPQLTGPLTVNGIKVSYEGIYISDPDDSVAVSQWANTVNGFLSANDDIVQGDVISTTATGFHVTIRTSMSAISASGNDSNNLFTGNVSASTFVITEFEDEQPLCLTNAQILSVIEKLDELCECNC